MRCDEGEGVAPLKGQHYIQAMKTMHSEKTLYRQHNGGPRSVLLPKRAEWRRDNNEPKNTRQNWFAEKIQSPKTFQDKDLSTRIASTVSDGLILRREKKRAEDA